MADDRLRFILDFVAQTAGLKNAQELAEALGDDLTDAEDAGKQMAAALKAAADKATKELQETVDLADKLGAALGPELTARVNVDEIAGKMRAVGMTTEQVEANIDDFRSSLSQMADTADQAKARMGDLDDGVRRVGDSSERSRSVMANFTGNAMQELPMMSGAFGPLNMAVGQFAEYATEGNIKLGKLLATGAGIGLVAVAMGQLADDAKKAAAIKAFNEKEVKDYAAALRKSDSVLVAVVDHLREAGKIEVHPGGIMDGVMGGDVTDSFARAGLSVDQFAAAINAGPEGVELMMAALKEAGVDTAAYADILMAADATLGNVAQSQKTNANLAKVGLLEQADAVDTLRRSTDDVSKAFDRAGRKWDEFMGKFDTEDAVANATLALGGLEEKLADIAERLASGELTDAEAWAEQTLAINGTTKSVADTVKGLGFLNTALASKLEILIEQGDLDEALAKILQLQRIAELMKADDWFGTNVGRSTPGGTREQTVDGERPIVVQSTTNLVVGDRTVQSMTAIQTEQKRGSR